MALHVLAVASIALGIYQLVMASRNFAAPDNDAVRLAGLGLPLMFLAFLNLIVWTQESPGRTSRIFTHIANGLLLVASVLVMRAVPVTFAFLVAGCTAALAGISWLSEIRLRK